MPGRLLLLARVVVGVAHVGLRLGHLEDVLILRVHQLLFNHIRVHAGQTLGLNEVLRCEEIHALRLQLLQELLLPSLEIGVQGDIVRIGVRLAHRVLLA